MVSLETPVCDFGLPAIEFALPGVDGKTWSLQQCKGPKGLLIMFICNHCPYVKAVRERIVRDVRELKALGINSVAIMSNDTVNYPDDSFENMKRIAKEWGFDFPYLLDESQAVARISLATMPICSCNTGAGSMPVARKRHRPMCGAICLKA